MMQIIFAGAAAVAMLALFDAARPDATETVLGSGAVRLTDMAVYLPAPASGPMGLQFPQTQANFSVGSGGFAAADDSDQAQQQAEQEEQQALQQLDEEQNEAAEQQFDEGMQQAQMDEQQANQ